MAQSVFSIYAQKAEVHKYPDGTEMVFCELFGGSSALVTCDVSKLEKEIDEFAETINYPASISVRQIGRKPRGWDKIKGSFARRVNMHLAPVRQA